MKKSILIVIDALRCGGAERSLISFLGLIDPSLYKIDLLLFSQDGEFQSELPNSVNIISPTGYLKDRSIFKLLKKIALRQLVVRIKSAFLMHINRSSKIHPSERLWKIINYVIDPIDYKYDVAIAYSQGFPTYFVMDKVTSIKKVAWINSEIHKAGYSHRFNEKYYKRYDRVVSVSEPLSLALIKEYELLKNKITTIYDIIDENFILNQAQKTGFDNNYAGVKLLTVGRLVSQKGYDIALQAAKILKDNGCSFCWYIIGDGPEKEKILDLISIYKLDGYFELLGLKTNPYPFINECDIYVQTSRSEGFGLTLSEAKILNKPIVTTNFTTAFNQITDGKNGLIADMRGDDVAEKILKLLNDKQLIPFLIEQTKKGKNKESETELNKIIQIIES